MATIDRPDDVMDPTEEIRYLLAHWSAFSSHHREPRCRTLLGLAVVIIKHLDERCRQLERAIETEGRLPVELMEALRRWKEGG
jgi:hypothetical protein